MSGAIDGRCDARLRPVREAFAENFAAHGEVGAAVAVTIDNQPVVDLWAGHADAARTRRWTRDTIVNVAAMTVAQARQVAEKVRRRIHDATDPGSCVIEVEPPATPAGTPYIPYEEMAEMPPHCDSLDGPVVTAAARALHTGNIELVLPYVHPDGEAEVRQAFARVLPLRAGGDRGG